MVDKTNKITRFVSELKRRRVTRLASIYAVAGLGIIEAFDIIGGRFQIPEGTIQFLIILVIAGFPLAIFLSWIFDITPKGIERTRPLTTEQQVTNPRLTWRPSWISVFLFLILIGISVAFFTVPRANALGFQKRDWIVIADLENNTNDEVFDRSLMHALSVTIDQSKYVNIFPRRRVLEVLQRMQIDSVGKIDVALALEIAEREHIKSVLALTISELDNTYLLSTRLLDPYTGETVRSRQVKAEGKAEILQALDELATTVRRDLGETLGQVLQRRIPLAKATTHSLEALKLFTDGATTWSLSRYKEAQALWTRAVELDSGFAWANVSLGLAAGFLESRKAAQIYFDRALNQMDRVTEKERLWIIALSSNDTESVTAYQTYLNEFPDDRDGWYNLGNALRADGRIEEAMEAYKQSLTLDPMQVWPHVNMGVGYDGLGRTEEAGIHFEKAFQLSPADMANWRGDVNRISGFVLVKQGKISQARERFELLLDREEGARANGLRSLGLLNMYLGKHSLAVDIFKQAVALNQRSEAPLSELRNRMYLARAYQSLGMDASVNEELTLGQVLAEENDFSPPWTVHMAIRLVDRGDVRQARSWLERGIENEYPNENIEWAVELLRGEIALAEGNTSLAITSLELADRLYQNLGLIIEALGRAYFANGQLEQAESSFIKAIQLMQLGAESQEPWALAHYRLALVYEAMGDPEKSRSYLEKFLDLWGSGDENLVGVADARKRLSLPI